MAFPMTTPSLFAHSLLSGTPKPFRGDDHSAIDKQPVAGPVRITWLGFEGNKVADPVHHGGWDKAIHLYPLDHHDWWRDAIGEHPLIGRPGAFGENIASTGMVETDFRLGDRFRLGTALVEVSHGRQPCWKLDHRFDGAKVMGAIVRTGRCGIYFRVIEEGEVEGPGAMELVERGPEQWTIARLFHLLIGGGHKSDAAALRELAGMKLLAEAWRERAAKLMA